MGYEINWNVNAGDPVLTSPFYQKYSQYDFTKVSSDDVMALIKADILAARASRESAAVINYLVWLLRTLMMVG